MINYGEIYPIIAVPSNFGKIYQVLPHVARYAKNGQRDLKMIYYGQQ
jgi:hypothetical protein